MQTPMVYTAEYLDAMKESGAPATTALETPFLYLTSLTVDSGKPTGLPACTYYLHSTPKYV